MFLKKVFLVYVLSAFCLAQTIQAQTWFWANSAGSNAYDFSHAVAVDLSGNSYTTGEFGGDSIRFGTATLYNSSPGIGRKDFFLAKYSASGAVLWSRSGVGYYDESCASVATDAAGNVYVTGYYSSDSVALGSTVLHSVFPGWSIFLDKDIFIAKYNSAGTLLWLQRAGTIYDDLPTGITVDAAGDVYVTGSFAGDTIRFGSTLLHNSSGGYSTDVFLAKYSSAGVPLWARSAGGYGLDAANVVKTDRLGNVFIGGKFTSDTFRIGSAALVNDSAGTEDVFIAGYNSSGGFLWANTAGGVRDDEAISLATDTTGNVYLAGTFRSSSIQFGTYTLPKTAATTTHGDIFLVKFSPGGVILWAKKAGGIYNDWLSSVAIDTSSYVYITGEFNTSSSIYFDAIELYPHLSGEGGFIAKYDPLTGDALSAHRVHISLPYLAVDPANSFILSGSSFGSSAFGSIILPFVGFSDAVIAKTYDTCTPPVLSPISGLSSVCSGSAITLTNSTSGGSWSSSSSFYATVSSSGVVTGIVPGVVTISYRVTRSCGSSFAVTQVVTINVSPAAGSISGSGTVCVGETVSLSASVAGGTWSSPGANATVSGTGDVSGVAPGVALISYTVSNSCGSVAATKLITVVPVSDCSTVVGSTKLENELSIYPNPVQDQFYIILTGAPVNANIMIIDMPGRVVKNVECISPGVLPLSISVADLVAGNYIVIVKTKEAVYRHKIIVRR